MKYVPRILLVSVSVWVIAAVLLKLTASQHFLLSATVEWSFSLAAFFGILGLFSYLFSSDLADIYAVKGLKISRNDICLTLSMLMGMFVGLPLSISQFGSDTMFWNTFSLFMGLFMIAPGVFWLCFLDSF